MPGLDIRVTVGTIPGLTFTGSPADSLAATDSVTAARSTSRTVADSAGLTDTASGSIPSGATWDATVAHGSQLETGHVGPWSLQGVSKGSENLLSVSLPARGYWRTDTPSEWAPTGTYVYNNLASNRGGVVPAGGLTIDGRAIPAGTVVAQFRDFSAGDFYVTSGQNFLLRGCRIRGTNRAPGYFNCAASQTSKIWIGYGDFGGLGAANAQYNEVPIKVASSAGGAVYRNYISYTTTGVQINAAGYAVVENLITDLAYFYGPGIPPGEATDKHLNGFTMNGGETCIEFRRNFVTLPTPDGAGRTINQTDAFSMFQDFGAFPGTGTNPDGSTGYKVTDNYWGGGGVTVYAGVNAGKAQSSVANLTLTGNRWTTQWYSGSGAVGPITATPTWGSNGNSQSDNRYADGPSAGNSVI